MQIQIYLTQEDIDKLQKGERIPIKFGGGTYVNLQQITILKEEGDNLCAQPLNSECKNL